MKPPEVCSKCGLPPWSWVKRFTTTDGYQPNGRRRLRLLYNGGWCMCRETAEYDLRSKIAEGGFDDAYNDDYDEGLPAQYL